MPIIIIKFKSVLSKSMREAIINDINDSLRNNRVILLDDSCDYEIVYDFERGKGNDKK
jgi:predicted protein tyrosine phosphatase